MKKTLYIIVIAAMSAMTFSCSENKTAKESEVQTVTVDKFNDPPIKEGQKSVLILSSSPRREGNSEQLCFQFKKGAEKAGHSVEMININDFDIRFFDQKEYDREAASNEIDDAVTIINKMKEADVIVLSSPVYFYNMTGQLKALIDRTYGHEKDLGEKEFYYIATSTDRNEDATDGVFEAFHGFARCLYHSAERGIIRGNGARNRGDIDSHPAMQQAYEMGKGV